MIPNTVIITEVSPRDGLQNEKKFVPTDVKIKFIELLSQAHFPIIETTAFVNPKKIPALADHDEVMKHFAGSERYLSVTSSEISNTIYSALIPNVLGLMNAMECGCKYVAVITAVSETFAQKNMGCSINESVDRIKAILKITKQKKMPVRAYISCTLGCPYEGLISHSITAALSKKLFEMGCDEIAIADTIGTGTPDLAKQLIQSVSEFVPIDKIAIHFHDTYGHAIENIEACLALGVSKIDASVGGLGGCPYAKGATGNVATEKVIQLLTALNIHTGIDVAAMKKASAFITSYIRK